MTPKTFGEITTAQVLPPIYEVGGSLIALDAFAFLKVMPAPEFQAQLDRIEAKLDRIIGRLFAPEEDQDQGALPFGEAG